ncbi:MAG: nucleotidyltransferase [Clostridia bacterium]|nr:nucleotidyltransferase [Clostridia bacterium]
MLARDFEEFCSNIKLDNKEDMESTVKDITKKLNKHYYDLDDAVEHMHTVGSVGRTTAIKNTSDLDILFELPQSVYDRINDNEGNKQSQLLQEVKNVLKDRYPNTDLRGDGQVVVINFSKYTVELVPAFKNDDDSYKYPDSNEGGKWRNTNPLPEIEKCLEIDDQTSGNFTNICHMLRAWKNKAGFKFKGLLIDTLTNNFLNNNEQYKNCNYEDYLNLIKDLFLYLKSQNKEQEFWHAIGSNQKVYDDGRFIRKAAKTYEEIKDLEADTERINKKLRKVFGREFPKRDEEETQNKYNYDNTEEFIEDRYQIDIILNVQLKCIVTQDGFRPTDLRALKFLKKNRKLEFEIENKSELVKNGVEHIIWKVKNEGEIAEKRNHIRGQLLMTDRYNREENTSFEGPHYVEVYVIKKNICVGKGRVDVNIAP